MAFEKVETQGVDFPALERQMLEFWERAGIFDRLRKQNAGKPRWSFLDGPITANNPMGVHHAWGRTYKDAYNRYFAMTGRELRYQQGFDCQGLWVEVEVEKDLGLKSKRDIENLVPGDPEASVAKFVQACKDRVNKFARVQTDQSIRLGYWMDWDRTDADWAKTPDERKSYFTMAEKNNFAIWAFLKKCHAKKLIYRGYDVMPWCGRCGVGLSEQEMKEGYKLVEHRSAFVKLPITRRAGGVSPLSSPEQGADAPRSPENLLVWTTTPWTLTSNVGAAINPELVYLKVKLKGEVYYVAKGAFKLNRMESSGDEDGESGSKGEPGASATGGKKSKKEWLDGVPHLSSIEQHFKSKAGKEGFTIEGEIRGEEMLGWEYSGPFDELPAQNHEFGFPEEVAKIVEQNGWCPAKTGVQSHRVVSGGKDVSDTEGTGIVHTAPGCGQIDFAWGKANGLPPVAPLDESGTFLDGFGPLAGKVAHDPATADVVFEELKKRDRLFATERYVHRYPHCWRCKTELLYRLVDEWFIDMGPRNTEEGFRGDIMKVVRNPEVKFLPESLNGTAREYDWLWNMGDWMISKKRYWGLALPIWVDEQDPTQFEVIGSREELKERAVEGWQEFDGHTPHRPYVDRVKIRNPKTGNLMSRVPDVGNPWLDAGIVAFSTMPADWRPADFITESFPGQFRNWFYALLAMSTMMSDGQPPFRNLLGFATMRDQEAKEMHKSEGNSIEFISAADEGFTLVHKLKEKAKAEKPDGALGFTEIEVFDKDLGKSVKAIRAAYPPIGADVMRWMYCRQDPTKNMNFGPVPANEVRAKFVIKLWNCYAFFANYARLDGFDPTADAVPVKDRPDIDRWILSDLQGLIRVARESFEKFDVAAFCLEAERFVDDRLSNWYVRRNRDRFWSKNAELDEAGKCDKLAAYQTLYQVLTTLSQLIAPVVPFLAEVMWQNLASGGRKPPVTSLSESNTKGTGGLRPPLAESVHLSEYPTPDETLVDATLSEDTDALLRLVSLGGACRNSAKINVRQPLAELRVSPGSDGDRRAVARFAEQIRDELNVKAVSLHDGGAMLRVSVRLNKKTANAKLGPKGKEADAALAALDSASVASEVRANGKFTLFDVDLDAADLFVENAAPEGWVGVADRGTQVMIDTRLTPDLKAEGNARDVVRLVQAARKDAGLDVSDKISLFLGTAAEPLSQAIMAHRDTIAGETQVLHWLDAAPSDGFAAEKKVDGQPITIAIRKA